MKEKRPLVWLSAEHSGCTNHATGLQEWRLLPIAIGAGPGQGDVPGDTTWVGVFDLSELSSEQLAVAGSWLEALRVEHWVAILEPGQIDNPGVCELINRYCEDYHTLPVQPERLNGILGHLWGMSELQARTSLVAPLSYHDIALEGESTAIRRTRGLLGKFSHTEEPVLIYGENGTGKEAAARFIHNNSPRRNKPLVVINCAALPPSLTQNELFGHEKGAFTHALSARKGRIEAADGGTLLLVGVDELQAEQQSAILRFLQEGQIERIGGFHPIRVNARLIATSTSPLEDLVASGRFRSDVFYRLGSLHVLLPPLRERKEDIPLLANRLLSATPSPAGPRRLAHKTTICLAEHPWPGNLRELQNRLRQASLLGEGLVIDPDDMGFGPASANRQSRSQELSLDAFRSQADRQAISVSLALAQNNISAAARLLNISRVSFYRLMDKHHVPHRTSVSPSKGAKGDFPWL
ncbi:sigma-54-dependent Fis family transcriptional regulator [Marinobacter vulgaris]|uniref:Sigma-54-dependent Fis family transcriptional regulator n=1 Tax=Marinobacter vulgaris TaxID=1928331 RepID=A0A2V3ZPN0_9GAMM|nr:sigma-54 dependent transcriptional regulator [Marinobacter vulgaris]PXX93475.1 sigma-54-dependent Fis family transcriptional regulator [Marinobacter vulgaris]TSJ72512.1 sigma-54-dependent Fis family transcriptional regulator [Marinobacter vulgaris]